MKKENLAQICEIFILYSLHKGVNIDLKILNEHNEVVFIESDDESGGFTFRIDINGNTNIDIVNYINKNTYDYYYSFCFYELKKFIENNISKLFLYCEI